LILPKLSYKLQLITAPKIHTDLLWDLSFLFIGLGAIYFLAIFFYRNRLSAKSAKELQRKRELSPMISEFIFHEEDASKDEKSNYVKLKIEIRQLIKDDFNRNILSEVLLDLQKDVSGDTQKRLFKLYQDLNLHVNAFAKLKSWRWEVLSKAIRDLTEMQVSEAYGFITKFINDNRATIRKQAEIATVTLRHEGLNYFLDTTKYKISEWQQLKLLDVIRNQKDYQPPRFKVWLTSTNSYVVLFALRLIKFYNQNDANTSLIELVKHKNSHIKEEAIRCIKEFHVVEALDTLKVIFWKSSTDIKISILDAIGSLGTEKDIDFLQLIENKESNFYVKSKALSSINVIAPERIMPSVDILDTSNYQIPDDLPVANTTNNVNTILDSSDTTLRQESQLASDEIIPEESQDDVEEKIVEEVKESQILEELPTDTPSIEFLPIVIEKLPEENELHDIDLVFDALKNLPVTFEELPHDNTKEKPKSALKEPYKWIENMSQTDFTSEGIAFLPIVVENVQEKPTEMAKPDKTPNPIHSMEVLFEIVERSRAKQIETKKIASKVESIILKNSESSLISFDQYNRSDIFNLNVVSEEIFITVTKEQAINNIEVIEPHFLSFPIADLEDNLMDNESNDSLVNLPLQEEMSPKDEEKFRKIINNLINFENKEEVNEIIEDLESSPLLEFENELIDISFIPLIDATEDDSRKFDNHNPSEKKPENKKLKRDQIEASDIKKNVETAIPKSILDEALTPYEIEDVNSEESTMQLLDDLSEMGDYREVTLLNEMLVNEKYVAVKEPVKKLLVRFSESDIESTPSKHDEAISLKAFNVFEDLFRTCDTEAKMILLNEMFHIGDTDDFEFLEGLLHDSEEDIQRKAAQVLEALRLKFIAPIESKKINPSESKRDLATNTVPQNLVLEEEGNTPKEYTFLMEELEINPSQISNDIFELSFEITADEFDDTQNLEKIYSHDETAQKSLMGQLCHLTHKIREKLNG